MHVYQDRKLLVFTFKGECKNVNKEAVLVHSFTVFDSAHSHSIWESRE